MQRLPAAHQMQACEDDERKPAVVSREMVLEHIEVLNGTLHTNAPTLHVHVDTACTACMQIACKLSWGHSNLCTLQCGAC
jgi:hypothetical protein